MCGSGNATVSLFSASVLFWPAHLKVKSLAQRLIRLLYILKPKSARETQARCSSALCRNRVLLLSYAKSVIPSGSVLAVWHANYMKRRIRRSHRFRGARLMRSTNVTITLQLRHYFTISIYHSIPILVSCLLTPPYPVVRRLLGEAVGMLLLRGAACPTSIAYFACVF